MLTDSRVPLHDGFTLYLDARRRPVFAVDGKRGRRGTVTGPALKAGRTYLLGASYDGKRLAIFVNGVQRATRSYRGGIDYAGGRSILVGGPAKGRSGGLAAYRGVLDELAVYGRALGAATLTDHFRRSGRRGPRLSGSGPGSRTTVRAGSSWTAATSTPAATCTAACGWDSRTRSPPGAPSGISSAGELKVQATAVVRFTWGAAPRCGRSSSRRRAATRPSSPARR